MDTLYSSLNDDITNQILFQVKIFQSTFRLILNFHCFLHVGQGDKGNIIANQHRFNQN